jgi:hypothetical protein
MTLMYHGVIEDIRTVTHNTSYYLHTHPGGRLELRRQQSETWKGISPKLEAGAMETWLAAYLEGLQDGYLVAKRGL